jgi:hypothetical protein
MVVAFCGDAECLVDVGDGPTTMWERWNKMLSDGTVNPADTIEIVRRG